MTGLPLDGIRVVELASAPAAFAGRLLAELGAEVVLVEPPGGHEARGYEPFVDDVPGPDRSLWWWHYQAGKRSVVLDVTGADADRFRDLVGSAQVVLEAEPPGRLAAAGVDHADLDHPGSGLVWASVTPFGRADPRSSQPVVDLTVLAGGGPVWSCGYDDHALPPVRGGGNQGFHTGSLWAVTGILTAVLHAEATGTGQLVDVNLHAAASVTTELASVTWMVAGQTVQRQTGRHAMPVATLPTTVAAADGRVVNTGVLPRHAKEFTALIRWIDDLDGRLEFPEVLFLERGVERGGVDLGHLIFGTERDEEAEAIMTAARGALVFIASKLDAYDFFVGAQQRGLPAGVVNAPEEVVQDPHLRATGFILPAHDPRTGRDYEVFGSPYRSTAGPWHRTGPAPSLGEHDDVVFDQIRTQEAAP